MFTVEDPSVKFKEYKEWSLRVLIWDIVLRQL